MEQARRINWSRVLNSAQNWLADLAIIQGDRDEAKMHIEQGLLTAEQSLNIRRYARYLRTKAKWEKEWGGIEEALTYAREAEGKFRTLRMESEAEEMSDWIKNLNILDQTP
jgi:LuxR family glucitol operon transcriptional activator